MSQTLQSNLIAVGWPEAEARRLALLPAVDRVNELPIVGNAWSDSPLFSTITDVLVDPNLTPQQKKAAVRKSYEVVGEVPPPLDTDAQIIAEIEKYVNC